jgi:hypothetical protein
LGGFRKSDFFGSDEFVEASMAKLDSKDHLIYKAAAIETTKTKTLEYYQQ